MVVYFWVDNQYFGHTEDLRLKEIRQGINALWKKYPLAKVFTDSAGHLQVFIDTKEEANNVS